MGSVDILAGPHNCLREGLSEGYDLILILGLELGLRFGFESGG